MWDYGIVFSWQHFLQYAARLCSGGCSHILPGLSYSHDSPEVLLCSFAVKVVISEVLVKSFRQIRYYLQHDLWCFLWWKSCFVFLMVCVCPPVYYHFVLCGHNCNFSISRKWNCQTLEWVIYTVLGRTHQSKALINLSFDLFRDLGKDYTMGHILKGAE